MLTTLQPGDVLGNDHSCISWNRWLEDHVFRFGSVFPEANPLVSAGLQLLGYIHECQSLGCWLPLAVKEMGRGASLEAHRSIRALKQAGIFQPVNARPQRYMITPKGRTLLDEWNQASQDPLFYINRSLKPILERQ